MNPKIRTSGVNRRFYNQYCYKLEISVAGSSFLRYPDLPIDQQLANRQRLRRSVNYGGSWGIRHLQVPSAKDLQILERILETKPMYESRLRFRIEEPCVQVYAEVEQDLYDFAVAISDLADSNVHLKKISRPSSNTHQDLLQQGYTITRSKQDYPYKVLVREGRYSKENKKQILNYLENQGDLVSMPAHFLESMHRQYDSVWNCYFYVKDKSILTMLSLINPKFVRVIEEYHIVSDK